MRTAALLVLASPAGPGRGAEPMVPAELQASIVLRLLAYDRALRARAGPSVVIAVVFKGGDKASTLWHDDMLRALDALQPQTVHGLSFVVLGHRYKDQAAFSEFVAKKGIDAVYLAPGLDAEVEKVRAVCEARKAGSISATRGAVEQGIAVAILAKGESPRLLVNLRAAQAAGMDLDPKLLLLAEVLR